MSHRKRPYATLRDVAARAGVSLATASRVINGAPNVEEGMRRKVLEAVSDLHYDTGGLILRRQETVIATVLSGCLAGGMEGFPCTASTAMGVSRRCRELGFPNAILTLDPTARVEELYYPNVRAYIFIGTGDEESKDLIRLLAEKGVPVVLVNRECTLPGVSFVGPDAAVFFRDAVEYLVRLGHERIAYINAVNSRELAKKRMDGFRTAMDVAETGFSEEYLITGEFTEETGRRALDILLALRKPPTAVIADSDQIAIGFCRRARELGIRVPEDISIVGIDDISAAAYADPPLTTVRMFYAETGMEAVDLAAMMLRTEGRMQYRATVRHELIIRCSAAVPNRERSSP